jgi:hypothetical protein
MEQSRSVKLKVSMNHGLIIGAILIAFAFLTSLAGKEGGSLIRLLHWAVIIAAIYYSEKTWRDQYCGGNISYSSALGFGVRTMFFASIIYGFYTMIYMNWIRPEAINETLMAIEESYFQMGFSDDQIEQFMDAARRLQTPVWQMITTILGTTFSGFIISLIVSLFIRKDEDPFRSAMQGLEKDQSSDN